MLTLHTFGPAFSLPDPSPFVTKAEVLLKMSGLSYQVKRSHPLRGPKGKLPYLEDGSVRLGDSTLIRLHLESRYGTQFDGNYDQRKLAQAWAVEKMLEEHLYFALLWTRWMDDGNFWKGPAQFFQEIPWPLRGLVTRMIRSQVKKTLLAQGMGRHRPQEIEELARRDLQALSDLLGEQAFLLGDQPCGADATVYAFVAGCLCPHFETPLRSSAEKLKNLVAYERRLKAQFYPTS